MGLLWGGGGYGRSTLFDGDGAGEFGPLSRSVFALGVVIILDAVVVAHIITRRWCGSSVA